MAYSKQNFQNGQILNAANLEAMENGIIAGQGAHNLLDNSDFSNPVNSRGKNTYSDGGNEYTIDRWKTQYDTNISIENGYINIFGSWDLKQRLKKPLGIIYTLAAKVRINSTGDYTPAVGIDGGQKVEFDAPIGEWRIYTKQIDISSITDETIEIQLASNGGSSSGSISVEWVALYEGSYTAETLPTYVPKDKHVEMLNCGVFLPPHNLLDNSDFTNPVNSRGQTSYSGIVYSMDKWHSWDSNNITTINDGNISVSVHIVQDISKNRFENGNTYTIALCASDGTIYVNSGVYTPGGEDFGDWTHTWVEITDSGDVTIYIRNGTYIWAALYEGAYDVSTLPPYVPKGKHIEMLNCGISLTPHNLLDNSDFRNPVNQRGIANSATIERYTYFLDRWRTGDTAGTITLDSNGLIFNVLISQKIDPAILRTGTTVTAAAKFSDGTLVIVSGVVNLSTSWHWFPSPVVDGCQIGLVDGTSDGIPYVRIGNEYGKTLAWAALYEGSYDASTLPAYQPKGYAAELAECQRYYRTMGFPVIPCANNPAGTQVYGFLPFRMRITPTVSCDTLYFFKGDSTFSSVSSASAESYGAGTRIVFNLSQSVEGNLAGAIAGNGIAISADL